MKCLMCNSTQLVAKSEVEKITYKEHKLAVLMAFTECKECGYDFVPAEQIKINDSSVMAAKRLADGLLTPEQIREVRNNLGLTQAQAAAVFGGGRNAFSKYERGEVAQSEAMDKLLRLCSAHPQLVSELANKAHHSANSQVFCLV